MSDQLCQGSFSCNVKKLRYLGVQGLSTVFPLTFRTGVHFDFGSK